MVFPSRPMPRFLLAGICLIALVFMATSSAGESAIMDELAHIPAGYGYVHELDFRLNPEHPPLLKALSAFPLLFANVRFPTEERAWREDVNGQWDMGAAFLYRAGNDADKIVRVARWAPMLFAVLLIIVVYAWASQLLGPWWALLPAALLGWSPNILAHGHYVTTDVAAAFGITLATWRFVRLLDIPSRRNLVLAGLAFGVAQAMKFSAVLLVPFFAALLGLFYLGTVVRDWYATRSTSSGQAAGARFRRFGIRLARYATSLVVIMAIGYGFVIYPLYALFTVNYPAEKQASDTTFILTSYGGGPTPAGESCRLLRCPADLTIAMTRNPVLRPLAEYALGVLMVVQRAAGGNTAYFMGEVSAAGSSSYFPVVYSLKEPIPTLIIVLGALLGALWALVRKFRERGTALCREAFGEIPSQVAPLAMFLFVGIYWFSSIQSPLNIGFRHLFPALPFMYILAAIAWKRWATRFPAPRTLSFWSAVGAYLRALGRISVKFSLLAFLLVWLFLETAAGYPYFLSYFNQFGGGTREGYRYVTDSNYDWGQDLVRLKRFVEHNPEIGVKDIIAVDYFGGGDPKYYLGDPREKSLRAGKAESWWSSRGDPRDYGIRWLAISVNSLQGAIQPAAAGFDRKPGDEYRWLTAIRPPEAGKGGLPNPDYRAGTSIFVYDLR